MDGQRGSQVKMKSERRLVTFRENLLVLLHCLFSFSLLPRYLLPALCHLSAEEVPRKVLLDVDTPALLVDFLSQSWTFLRGKTSVASTRDPSMETACSALLNFTVTEPERVR